MYIYVYLRIWLVCVVRENSRRSKMVKDTGKKVTDTFCSVSHVAYDTLKLPSFWSPLDTYPSLLDITIYKICRHTVLKKCLIMRPQYSQTIQKHRKSFEAKPSLIPLDLAGEEGFSAHGLWMVMIIPNSPRSNHKPRIISQSIATYVWWLKAY